MTYNMFHGTIIHQIVSLFRQHPVQTLKHNMEKFGWRCSRMPKKQWICQCYSTCFHRGGEGVLVPVLLLLLLLLFSPSLSFFTSWRQLMAVASKLWRPLSKSQVCCLGLAAAARQQLRAQRVGFCTFHLQPNKIGYDGDTVDGSEIRLTTRDV